MIQKLFNYSIHHQYPNLAVIRLGKSVLGGNEALSFTSTVSELIDKKMRNICIDLSGVEIMNSSGLGMLVSALSTCKKHNMKFVLTSPPEKVMSLLKMTHLDHVFSIYATVEEAISDFN